MGANTAELMSWVSKYQHELWSSSASNLIKFDFHKCPMWYLDMYRFKSGIALSLVSKVRMWVRLCQRNILLYTENPGILGTKGCYYFITQWKYGKWNNGFMSIKTHDFHHCPDINIYKLFWKWNRDRKVAMIASHFV